MRIEDLRYLIRSSSLAGVVPYISNSSSFNFKNTPVNQINPGEFFWNQQDKKLWLGYQDASNNLGVELIYPQSTSGGSGTDVFVTGGTYSAGTATFTNNTGGTFNVTGFFTGGSSGTDVFVTGATYNNNTFTYTNNTGGTFNVSFDSVTGLTADTISATTYQNLPPATPLSGTLILLDAQETESTGTGNQTAIFSYTVAANTYSRIMVESEVGFRSQANSNSTTTFVLQYDGVTKRNALIEFDATGAGDQHAAGYTLKYSEAFTGGGVVRINTTLTSTGTWTVESFRVYGII